MLVSLQPGYSRNFPPRLTNFEMSGSIASTTSKSGLLARATSLSKFTGRALASHFGSLNTKKRKKSSASPNGFGSVNRYQVSSLPGYGGGNTCSPVRGFLGPA